MTHISRVDFINQSQEQALELVTTESPPRVSSPEAYMSTEQVFLYERQGAQDKSPVEIVKRLLDVLGPSQSGNPVLEALYHANPNAFHILSRALHMLFKPEYCHLDEEIIKNVLNLKSLEFFECDYRHLSEANKRLLSASCLKSTRADHCRLILNEIAYEPDLKNLFPAAIVDLEDVKKTLSRDHFQDEADFERHLLKFEREGEKLTLAEKVKAYEFIRRMIIENWSAVDNAFSIPDIRVTAFNFSFSLSYVPPELWDLTYLTVLNLSGGALTSLSPQLGELTQLTSLDVSDNALTSLPGELVLLTNLTSLYIHINRFEVFPPHIAQLTQLLNLFCGTNPFQILPPAVGNLTKLETLSLYSNQLKSLPIELKMLSHLTQLIVCPGKMKAIPEVMVYFRNLTILQVYFPDITEPFTPEVTEWLLHLRSRGCDFGGHVPV